jgi:hypothetical protein
MFEMPHAPHKQIRMHEDVHASVWLPLHFFIYPFLPMLLGYGRQFINAVKPHFVHLLLHHRPDFETGFKTGLFGSQSVGGMKSGLFCIISCTVFCTIIWSTVLLEDGMRTVTQTLGNRSRIQNVSVIFSVDLYSWFNKMDRWSAKRATDASTETVTDGLKCER